MKNDRLEANAPSRGNRPMWSLVAYRAALRAVIARKSSAELQSKAVQAWDIAPGGQSIAPPAFFLPDQLERVTGWEFYPFEHPRRTMEGVGVVDHGPTRGFLLKDVWLIDGTLYKDNAKSWLCPRSGRLPRGVVEHEIGRGAVYCTAPGNKWFGSWLMEDCVTYSLARDEGLPVTTAPTARSPLYPQMPIYEDWLDMRPTRLSSAFFHELVLFDDLCQNRNKHRRYRAMGEKLLARVSYTSHPGVFILRGGTGERRMLHNELELAEHLRVSRGFRIVDPARTDVPSLVAACAGARVVIGVEGSHLVHGVNVLQPGGALLTLQPPNRFVSYYKFLTDRDNQHFGFVVGTLEGEGFRIDVDEVERTLDLFPA